MGGSKEPTYPDLLDKVSRLINQGKFREAQSILDSLPGRARPSKDGSYKSYDMFVDFWLQMALVLRLRGKDKDADRAAGSAKDTSEWNSWSEAKKNRVEGDFLRDEALSYIRRRRNQDRVLGLLRKVSQLHDSDQNRLACVEMAYGRHDYSQGDYQGAYAHFASAAQIWDYMQHPNKQWMRNNNFHWLRAAVMLDDISKVHELAAKVEDDPRRSRRVVAKLLVRYGNKGAVWIDKISPLYSVG